MTNELMLIALDNLKVRVVKKEGATFPFAVESRMGTTRWVQEDAFVERADAFKAAVAFVNQH